MVKKVSYTLVDDLDGTDAAETINFGLDGSTYEIDLSDENAAALREALAGYIGAGRRVSGARRQPKRSTLGPSSREVRDWARSNGHEVSDRGRVPAELMAAYAAAH